MECLKVDEHLEAYIDGELSPELSHAVADHLEDCPDCLAMWEQASRIASELRGLPLQKCPEKVTRVVLNEIQKESEGRTTRESGFPFRLLEIFTFKRSFAAVAAALVLIAIFAYIPWHRAPESPYTPEEIEQARQVIAVAFGYVNHATVLAQDILKKERVEEKVVAPITKGIGLDRLAKRKGDNS